MGSTVVVMVVSVSVNALDKWDHGTGEMPDDLSKIV